MADTHDLGPAFVHTIRLVPDAPRFHLGRTTEIEWPFRAGRPLIVRYWGERAIVIGWWRHTGRSEDDALRAALSATDTDAFDAEGAFLDRFDHAEF